MECIGVDVYVISSEVPKKIPRASGALKLEMVSSLGTKVDLDSPPKFTVGDWFRCRYQSQSSVKDADIANLLKEVEATATWEKVQKLFRKNGKNLFSGSHDS